MLKRLRPWVHPHCIGDQVWFPETKQKARLVETESLGVCWPAIPAYWRLDPWGSVGQPFQPTCSRLVRAPASSNKEDGAWGEALLWTFALHRCVCVCLCVHMHTYTPYTCLHTEGHTCTYEYTCTHTYVHTCMYTYTCIGVHTSTNIQTNKYIKQPAESIYCCSEVHVLRTHYLNLRLNLETPPWRG